MTEFNKIRNEGRLAFEYVKGSTLYGLNTPTSDVDTGGVYLCTPEELYGCYGYKPQVSDDRHDNTWFEIGEFVRLLLKSNPAVLEALFIPEDKIMGDIHPIMQPFIDNRDRFVTQQCFAPFFGYAKSQIEKARGFNKKIVNPVEKLLSAMDFTYTFRGQGSEPFGKWLDRRGLRQEYCGLVNIPNMRDMHGVYYDFGMHCSQEEEWRNDSAFVNLAREYKGYGSMRETIEHLSELKPIGYRGVFNMRKDSNQLRLSSIEDKDARPICFISYNQDAYSQHCRAFAEYERWVRERNPERYQSNLDKTYDSKNMMHMFRLIHMATEIAEGRGVILERTWDRQFLMDIRAHKFEYDELMHLLTAESEKMSNAMENSLIPKQVDTEFVNSLMIEVRRHQFA